MRLILTAAAIALSLGALPAPASAAEHRMTGAELRDIAQRGLLWCEEYDAAHDDCDVVTLVRLMPDGTIAETSTLLLQAEPRLQVYIADTDRIEGDRMCSKVEAAQTRFVFTLNGETLPETSAAGLRALFIAQMADMEGKMLCQAFFRSDDPTVIREEITVDGARRTDLESTYHLRDADTDLKLRPQFENGDNTTRTSL
jgi:hypothetical protein